MRNKFISSLPLLKKLPLNIPAGVSNAAGTEAHYNISIAGKDYNVYFKSSDAPLHAGVEPLLILALLPAMKLGADIVLSRPISRDLADNLEKFMKIFGSWYKDFNPVKILGERLEALPVAGGRRVGVFFSGGVDSFYTLLKHKNEITDLIYIRGYDIDLKDDARHHAVSETCAKVAGRLGKNLLVLETNARRMLKGYGKWGQHQFGPALGSAAQILSARFRKIYVASDFDEENLRPWGSHPRTTPLFGNSVIDIVYDGTEAKRIEKLKKICEYDIALNNLRVCFKNVAGTYNCGKCEKCLRTMIGLYALNKLKDCATFPIIDASLLQEKLYDNETARVFARENLSLLEAQGKQRSPIYISLQKAISLPLRQVKLKSYYQSKIQKLFGIFHRWNLRD